MTDSELVSSRIALSDGVLTWRSSGKPVCFRQDRDGYRELRIRTGGRKMRFFREHRVIWFLHYGAWPEQVIDHINGDPSDNRIENLRDVSPLTNARNRRGSTTTRTASPVFTWGSVHLHGTKWRVRMPVDGKRVHLGFFETKAEAEAAKEGASRLHAALVAPDITSAPSAPPDTP